MADLKSRRAKMVKDARKRHHTLLREASQWRETWKKLAEFFSPRKYRSLYDGDEPNGSDLTVDRLVTSVSVRAVRVLAAGMQGGMTSPARPWFRLGIPDQVIEGSKAVKTWLDESQRRILTVLSRTNFYDAIHQIYAELANFGTGSIYVLEDPDNVVRFKTLTAGEYTFYANHTGRVVGCYRIMSMTAEQIVDRFGEDRVSHTVRSAWKEPGAKDHWFKVVHMTGPNPDIEPDRLDERGKPFISLYYEYEASEPALGEYLEIGGYDEQPFAGPRWDVTGADVYGKGPAEETLNDVRQLQSMTKSMLKALHKQTDPPMIAPPGMATLSFNPSAINIIDNAQGQGVRPAYQVRPEVEGTMLAVQEAKNDIREGLYNDLFKMLALAQTDSKTATEVRALVEEKLIMLGPVVERLHNELLDVVIDRVFGICMRAGVLPPPPPEIQGRELKVEYISILAQAQKMIGTTAVEQFMGMVGQYGQIFPEMRDVPDADSVAEHYADLLGIPTKLLKSKEDREKERMMRAQQQAQAAQAEAMAQASGTMRNMAGVDPEQANAAAAALTGGLVQ